MPGSCEQLELLRLSGRFKHLPRFIDGTVEVRITAQDQDRTSNIINVIDRPQLIASHPNAWLELT